MSTAILLVLAANPIGIARFRRRDGWLAAAVILAAATVGADTVLDVLDLSPEGFWIAAGVLLLVPAFPMLRSGDHREVVGPAPVAAAMALATRDGLAETLLGVALVAALALAAGRWERPSPWIARAFAAAMVVLAFDLIRDGVIAV
jgi:small neutral amino acid transporter SnatA (MarC family)